MPVLRERTDLDKKPLWFLFLAANVIVLLGCAITWILVVKSDSNNLLYLPTLICNLVSLICAGVFMYFEIKDIAPKILHFQKKWTYWYIASAAVYVAAILFNVLYYLFFLGRIPFGNLKQNAYGWELAVYFAITGFLTLISIGLQRYARFRIDLDIYRRKHGENPNDKDLKIENEKDEKTNSKSFKNNQTKDEKKDSKKPSASGGLLDQME